MKIRILLRIFFEKIKGTAEEDRLLESYRIISINSSRGDDSLPPFSERNRNHRNLLCLTFDDVCNEPDGGDCICFSIRQAEAVMRFADDGSTPMLIHCSAGISRSGAVGEIPDWYFNRFLMKNEPDHLDFCRNNRHIIPNPPVREIMVKYIGGMNDKGNLTMPETRFIVNREIYEEAVLKVVPSAKQRLWIATADIKDMYVEKPGLTKQMVPFLQILAELLKRGVAIRLIHAKEPGPAFRQDFDRFPGLWTGIERVLCPRVHFKCIIADGKRAYFGSANLTGAGMGAKGENRRNFENGILTDDPALIEPLAEQFDSVWRGAWCGKCGRRDYCTDCPLD